MLTVSTSSTSSKISSHDPRCGIILAVNSFLPLGCTTSSKVMPGDLCNWLTITRSAPFITNVPRSVMSGISPMYTSLENFSLNFCFNCLMRIYNPALYPFSECV
jgi:hypothetical protein